MASTVNAQSVHEALSRHCTECRMVARRLGKVDAVDAVNYEKFLSSWSMPTAAETEQLVRYVELGGDPVRARAVAMPKGWPARKWLDAGLIERNPAVHPPKFRPTFPFESSE